MKNRIIIATGIMMLVFLTACGTNDTTEQEEPTNEVEVNEETNNETDETANNDAEKNDSAASTETNDDGEMESQAAQLNFVEISIEVSYGADQEFEASLDRDDDDHDRIDAEIEDEINSVFLEGRDAFDHIFPKLETLDITAETAEQEVIDQVLNAFDLAEDYEKFEIEVDFEDRSKLDFETRQ